MAESLTPEALKKYSAMAADAFMDDKTYIVSRFLLQRNIRGKVWA